MVLLTCIRASLAVTKVLVGRVRPYVVISMVLLTRVGASLTVITVLAGCVQTDVTTSNEIWMFPSSHNLFLLHVQWNIDMHQSKSCCHQGFSRRKSYCHQGFSGLCPERGGLQRSCYNDNSVFFEPAPNTPNPWIFDCPISRLNT